MANELRVGGPTSLYVDGVMKAGHVYPEDLSPRDKTKIRKTIQKEIWRSRSTQRSDSKASIQTAYAQAI